MTHRPMLATAALATMISGCSGLPFVYGGGGGALMCEDLGAGEGARKIAALGAAGGGVGRGGRALAAAREEGCAGMPRALGARPPHATEGALQVEATCTALATEMRAIVEDALPRDARLEVAYAAPECHVSLDAMASCVARCDASLDARSEVSCTEDVVGRSCWGESEARADAQCEAACEAEVTVSAVCTEPSVSVVATATVDPEAQARFDALVATLERHYPRFVALEARLGAVAESGAELVATFGDAMESTGRLGLSAMACFADTTAATAGAMSTVEVSVRVSVEVSASVSAG